MVLLSFISACATCSKIFDVYVLFVFVELAVKKMASGKLYSDNIMRMASLNPYFFNKLSGIIVTRGMIRNLDIS